MTPIGLTLKARRGGQLATQTPAGLELTAEIEWLLQEPADLVAAAHAALPGVTAPAMVRMALKMM